MAIVQKVSGCSSATQASWAISMAGPRLTDIRTGRPVRFVDRYRFLKSLYDGIKDKERIHTREGIVSYTETADGVQVHTDKGNVFEGSILVGCDGVHSEVRKQIAEQVKETNPKAANILSKGFKTRYCCLTSLSNNHHLDDEKRVFLRDGTVANCYHPKERIGGVCSAGTPGQLIWSLYIPLECIDREAVGEYPSPKFTQADVDLIIERYGHLHMGPGFTVADAFQNMVKGASIISMEENVLPTRWNNGGRVVILGDAVHKATANLGLGGNLCIDDVCRLANGLVPLLAKEPSSSSGPPSTAQLTKVFDDMEKASRPRAEFVRRASSFFCGFETWTGWYAPIVKVLFPWIPSSMKMQVFDQFDAAAPKLDFLPVPQAEFSGEE